MTRAVIHEAPSPPPRFLALKELSGLLCIAQALFTIGEGLCSVAAVLIALDMLPDHHFTNHYRAIIDAVRITLGQLMAAEWDDDRWMREAPLTWRMSRTRTAEQTAAQTSYEVFRDLLLDSQQSCVYLEPSLFCLLADKFEVGIFVMECASYQGSAITQYWHVRPEFSEHIVVRFASRHFRGCAVWR